MNTTENIAADDHSVSAAGEYERQHDDPVGQALVLADALKNNTSIVGAERIEATLRRLHAENDALRERVQEVGAIGRSEHVRRMELEAELKSALAVAEMNAVSGASWAARVQELEAQMEAIGAGGVSGPLFGG